MARKKSVQLTLRFRLNDEKERQLYKAVDEVDKSIYKSKNKFIMDAIDAYVNGTGVSFSEASQGGIYVTQEQFQEMIAKVKNEIRIELYQELIVFLAKSGVSAALLNASAMQNTDTITNPVEEISTQSHKEESIPAEILADIEKWSYVWGNGNRILEGFV